MEGEKGRQQQQQDWNIDFVVKISSEEWDGIRRVESVADACAKYFMQDFSWMNDGVICVGG